MEKAMLTFDKVNAHYGKIQALHDVSLHINQGEIVTLIGANGAGKTTLLGTLCGDPRATSGRIVFDGKDITDWQTAKIMREAVAAVLRGRAPRILPHDSEKEDLAMGGFFTTGMNTRPASSGCTTLPAPVGASYSACGHHVRRRAADAGDWPRADEPAASAVAGRAVARSCADHHPADFRHHRAAA